MLLQHRLVVHLVDVIAGEQDDEAGGVALDDVDVLVDGVGGAGIPAADAFAHALAGGEDVEAFVALGAEEVPAALEVPDEAVGLVLGGDADAADAGIERVAEGEVDDAAFAAEIDGGFGAIVGQFLQARAAAAGQDVGHGAAREGGGGGAAERARRDLVHVSVPVLFSYLRGIGIPQISAAY